MMLSLFSTLTSVVLTFQLSTKGVAEFQSCCHPRSRCPNRNDCCHLRLIQASRRKQEILGVDICWVVMQNNEEVGYLEPRCSMYGIFTYIHHKFMGNVGKYSLHGAYGEDHPRTCKYS